MNPSYLLVIDLKVLKYGQKSNSWTGGCNFCWQELFPAFCTYIASSIQLEKRMLGPLEAVL